jgi:hypothetical protein
MRRRSRGGGGRWIHGRAVNRGGGGGHARFSRRGLVRAGAVYTLLLIVVEI